MANWIYYPCQLYNVFSKNDVTFLLYQAPQPWFYVRIFHQCPRFIEMKTRH